MATFGAKVHAFQDPDELYVWAKKINVHQDALVQERLEYLYNIRVRSQDFSNESVARMYIMAESNYCSTVSIERYASRSCFKYGNIGIK